MSGDLGSLRSEALEAIANSATSSELEQLRVSYLGKKGKVTESLKSLASLPVEERKTFGQEVNKLKDELESLLFEKKRILESAELESKLALEGIDITLSPRPENTGLVHPVSRVIMESASIFRQMGFTVAEGPDIEDDFHNFEALNFPIGHPAREMHDTFYLPQSSDGRSRLLRTHTSTVQIRIMKNAKPPYRFVAIGRTYRCDSDATHSPMFHQIEGVVIDRAINMGHLKGCLAEFLGKFFGLGKVPMRFRPSFFPFTEPSAEVDIACSREGGLIKIGEGSGWLEILGSGMVHPNVLKNCGIDPNEWQGFAFGMGLERLAMLKYGIPDLRAFFDGDARWLKHYGFSPVDSF